MGVLDRFRRQAEEKRQAVERARQPASILTKLAARLSSAPEAAEAPPPPGLGTLRARRKYTLEERNPALSAEIRRITGLPVSPELSDEDLDAISEQYLLADQYTQGYRLFRPQAEGILEYLEQGGLFGPIGVGWGKTMLLLSIANLAYRKGLKRGMYIMPASVYPQLVDKDLAYARNHIPFSVPVHLLGGLPSGKRLSYARSGQKGCYLVPVSLMSRGEEIIDAIQPEYVLVDEAHMLKNRNAGRTKVIMNYVIDKRPEFVAVSGTITSKSIRDYHHLIKAALHDNSPLPLPAQMASEWAQVIDAQASPSWKQTGPLMPLIDWAHDHFPEDEFPEAISGFRHAFRRRLTSAPGVVATGDSEIGTSIVMANRKVEGHEDTDHFRALKKLIDKVNHEWVTPSGDEIEHAIHTWKWLFELSAGFYNELVWPEPEAYAKRKTITLDEATELLQKAKDHHALGQIYARHLRDFLKTAPLGLQTPMLVGGDMAQHGAKNVGHDLYEIWKEMKEAEFEGMPERDKNAIRVSPYKLEPLVPWAKEVKAGIVWYFNQEMGEWATEFLREHGIDALHCPAGSQHNKAILAPSAEKRIVVASMSAHGTGKNLQAFQANYFLQWPRDSTLAEQTLGRTHRNGQVADELRMVTCNTLEFDLLNFAACVNDSVYIHTTTGNRQKLVYADYDPLPVIFPPEALRERGFQNKMLTSEQRTLMDETFAAPKN